ncbi:hypothetical protein DBR11_05380 [Pedobacter sp. HMWF019]|uniref:hypothetical protein n=1 Tax=Pedobacter sp. HMWF019 TaxID=2056856 RepID=UPI000D3D3E91|nr:hypothetical protein [Pedobacter sp. HMWF019]PTT02139.1 hypothetical protein DBR11_05380 [Pedobacter sp. HMWF019]
MKKKNLAGKKNIKHTISGQDDGEENLGLDADHSSNPLYHNLNNDNDWVSHNPDGEEDHIDKSGFEEENSIMNK